jgi:SAM-dependent methyltransferase
MELVEHLAEAGFDIAGRSCLDIGCGNGALALACLQCGASEAMAVDASLGRLSSAKRLCAGSDVRFRVVDMVEERLDEEFDVIFCMDVLEHVPSAENLIAKIARSLRNDPSSFAYVTLFNHNFMPNVLSEPHFSVPGLVRVPSDTAWSLWEEIRSHYHSTLDYDVYDWFDYAEYVDMAERAGLRLDPIHIDEAVLRACADTAAKYEEEASRFRIDFSMRLAELPVGADTRRLLEAHVEDYLDQFHRDHESFPLEDSEAVRQLYLKYYAQPLTMIFRPDGSPEIVAPDQV